MKTFNHQRPVRDWDGKIIGMKDGPAIRKTAERLGRAYGPDHNKRLVVELRRGDLIAMRPEKTRREYVFAAHDIYAWMIRTKAQQLHNLKAEEKLDKKAARLSEQRQKRFEKRFK